VGTYDLAVGTCGCCAPPPTPAPIHNRPALAVVEYRVGTFPTFRRAMITLIPRLAAELADDLGLAEPPLQRWTSEEQDDYGVAFIEMWATIADVLTFYQERYANLAWLRTAPDRDAVRKLAQLLGYRLKPGVAAQTHMSFTVDADVPVTIAAGSRIQSVPDEGQTPQKFETSAAVAAEVALNKVRVWGAPDEVGQLDRYRTSGTLAASSPIPLPGDRMILTDPGTTLRQEVTVGSTTEVDGRTIVGWSHSLVADFTVAHIAKRRFRLFGHDAPATHLVPTPAGTGSFLTWTSESTLMTVSGESELYLDGTMTGLEPGMDVLVFDPDPSDPGLYPRSILGVTHTTHTVGPVMGAATKVELDSAVSGSVDTMTVLELGDEILFQDWQIPDSDLAAGTTDVYVSARDVSAIGPKRWLVLDDDSDNPMLVQVKESSLMGPATGAEFLRITLKSPTSRSLDDGSAFLLGNVVAATHGETVAGEIVGNGDQSRARQRFTLAKTPVTHTSDPTAPGAARNSLQLFVDNVRWAERSGLFGADATDRTYSTSIDDDQTMYVQFGDGVQGARLPTGRANIVATYRQGLGIEGNLRAGQIRTALDKPIGVKEARNPFPSTGGVDPETTAGVRENAPNTVRTFDRAVSLRDFADLARECTGVAKAFATWVWDDEERVVHVTVGGEGGAAIDDLSDVRTYLDLRRDPNRALRVDEYRPVPFVVDVTVDIDEDRFRELLEVDVAEAIADYFAYEQRAFGQAVHLSDVYAVVQTVPGVVSLMVDRLRYKNAADFGIHAVVPAWVLVHAPVFGARHDPSTGTIAPAELAEISTSDISVTITGGIAS
jgi:hypothetical protein